VATKLFSSEVEEVEFWNVPRDTDGEFGNGELTAVSCDHDAILTQSTTVTKARLITTDLADPNGPPHRCHGTVF
jgi:hypothetical protein